MFVFVYGRDLLSEMKWFIDNIIILQQQFLCTFHIFTPFCEREMRWRIRSTEKYLVDNIPTGISRHPCIPSVLANINEQRFLIWSCVSVFIPVRVRVSVYVRWDWRPGTSFTQGLPNSPLWNRIRPKSFPDYRRVIQHFRSQRVEKKMSFCSPTSKVLFQVSSWTSRRKFCIEFF